jgi:hypothetical protein
MVELATPIIVYLNARYYACPEVIICTECVFEINDTTSLSKHTIVFGKIK